MNNKNSLETEYERDEINSLRPAYYRCVVCGITDKRRLYKCTDANEMMDRFKIMCIECLKEGLR